MATLTYTDVTARSTVIDGVATTGLRNLANNTCRLGPEIDPGATPPLYSSYQLTAKFGSNPTAGAVVAHCWFVVDAGDSGTYPTIGASSDGSTTVYPTQAPDFVFYWDLGTAHAGAPDVMQSVPAVVSRPPHPHKVLFRNVSGATTANTNDTDTVLRESTFNEASA